MNKSLIIKRVQDLLNSFFLYILFGLLLCECLATHYSHWLNIEVTFQDRKIDFASYKSYLAVFHGCSGEVVSRTDIRNQNLVNTHGKNDSV